MKKVYIIIGCLIIAWLALVYSQAQSIHGNGADFTTLYTNLPTLSANNTFSGTNTIPTMNVQAVHMMSGYGAGYILETDGSGNMYATNIADINFSVYLTNISSGQLVTNLSGFPLLINASGTYTTAAVTGSSRVEMRISGAASGNYTNKAGTTTTLAITLSQTYDFSLNATWPPNGVLSITNTGSGGGNSSSLTAIQITRL